MSLKLLSRFPGGNATAFDTDLTGPLPEVRFASDPCGGSEALWFHLRIEETEPQPTHADRKLRLTWMFTDTLYGMDAAAACVPVILQPGQPWVRLKQGEESHGPDGQRQLSWTIPHPAPAVEVALSFPYLPGDLTALLRKSKDFWSQEPIGVTQGGRILQRLRSDSPGGGGRHPGVYLVARQHGGETPASWVLDGILRQLAQTRKGGFDLRAVPFADLDGVLRGHFGRGGFPADLDRAWTDEPARHEARVIARDLERWKARCTPALLLDLQCPGIGDRDGVFATVAPDPGHPLAKAETKWCNVIKTELTQEFAAGDFQCALDTPGSLTAFARDRLDIPAVRLLIPYTHAGSTVLTPKTYRDIGQRIAKALVRKGG